MFLMQLATEAAKVGATSENVDGSWIFDWVSLIVAVIVGIGSALITGRIQSSQDSAQRRREALRSLIDYEIALSDAENSLEADTYNFRGPPFPKDLNSRRLEAYPHFRFLQDTGVEDDKKIYWLLYDPTSGDITSAHEAIEAYGTAHRAMSGVIKRVQEGEARPPVRSRLSRRRRVPSNAEL